MRDNQTQCHQDLTNHYINNYKISFTFNIVIIIFTIILTVLGVMLWNTMKKEMRYLVALIVKITDLFYEDVLFIQGLLL